MVLIILKKQYFVKPLFSVGLTYGIYIFGSMEYISLKV